MNLPYPIKDVLRESSEEISIERMWDRVRSARPPRSLLRTPAVGFFAGAGATAMVALAVIALDRPRTLKLAGGEEPHLLAVAATDAPRATDFDDGSRVILLPSAKLETTENTASRVSFVLEQGRAAFEVRPGGPRKWMIDCGLAMIEVVGTRFFLERTSDRLRVSVEEGVVIARGERVPAHIQRLEAGAMLEVLAAKAPAALPRVELQPSLRKRMQADLQKTTAEKPARAFAPPVRVVAPSAVEPPAMKPDSVPAANEVFEDAPRPAPSRERSAEELLALADSARVRGDYAAAAETLERLLRVHAGDPSAPIAAFTLGKLELEQLGHPRRAASAFERALGSGLPHVLRKDALAYLADAYTRLGDHERAQRTRERE